MFRRKVKKCLKYTKLILCMLVSGLLLFSCTASKQLNYFNDLPDSAVVNLPPFVQQDRVMQVGDRLQITFGGYNVEAAEIFNSYGGSATSGGSSGRTSNNTGTNELSGYLIDVNGNVEFPLIGKVKAIGMTTRVLEDTLTNRVRPYLKDPLVTVKFMIFKFTVLGEVRSPGTFNLPMQRTTILDALGAAHDLPRAAKRYDVQIYRDYNGKRSILKVDLRKKELLYDVERFQVRHNDIIYVRTRESRMFSQETQFYTSLITVAAGLFAIFSNLIFK